MPVVNNCSHSDLEKREGITKHVKLVSGKIFCISILEVVKAVLILFVNFAWLVFQTHCETSLF